MNNLVELLKGGSGSGNFGHSGRKGKRGGSAPKGGGLSSRGSLTPGDIHEEFNWDANDFIIEEPPDMERLAYPAASFKNYVCETISKDTGIPYENVDGVIAQWAQSSNDSDYRSLCLQESVSRVFGVELSDWQKEQIFANNRRKDDIKSGLLSVSVFGDTTKHILEGLNLSKTKYKTKDEALDAITKSMYNTTQKQLKEAGISETTLYRGVSDRLTIEKMVTVKVKGNAASSWTSSKQTATDFSTDITTGNVLKAKIPASRILSTPKSGWGCFNEKEFVIIGDNNPDEVLVIQ